MNEYTDLKFWEKYWEDLKIVPGKKIFFEKLITDFPDNVKLIEVGGFPGKLATYFKKVKNYNVTILDYYIDPANINQVEEANELPAGSINFIKGDFLNMDLPEEYDIVCSFGFLEHFNDTKDIIERHLKLLKKGGTLFITIPNFRGINGWFQKKFHFENYKKHNIKCMDINTLNLIIRELKLRTHQIDFFGDPMIWFENDAKVSKVIYFIAGNINRVIKRLPFKSNSFLAPYIYIKAIK
jgi:2-polyprenyl-3-methyl-5-hydroxy-6-metoxy-1,4-benzoquinol methylase